MIAAPTICLLPLLLCGTDGRSRSIPFPGTLEYATTRDVDGDGREDLVLVGVRRGERGELERLIRVHPCGSEGPLPERFGETPVGNRWSAVCWCDWIALPGLELIAIEPHGVRVHPLDPDAPPGRPTWHPQGRTLFEGATYLERPDPAHLPHWRLQGDWNGDGRPELLVPLPRGYLYLSWAAGGRAALRQRLELEPYMMAHRVWDAAMFAVERELPVPTLLDTDGDGSLDLVYEGARQGRLIRHRGARRAGRGLRFDAPEVLDGAGGGARAEEARVQKSFRRLADLDGDGRADLVGWRILGNLAGGLKFETVVAIRHALGDGESGFCAPRELRFRGAAAVPVLPDLNGDGRIDLVVARAEGVLAAALTGRALLRYAVYLQDGEGSFPAQPSVEFAHRIPTEALTEEDLRNGRLPAALDLAHDLDGDGVPDLLLVNGGEGFEVRLGRLERRSHEGRRWDVLRYEDGPWIEHAGRTSFRYGYARQSLAGRGALWFAHSDGVELVFLP